jgi:hypothetical protein
MRTRESTMPERGEATAEIVLELRLATSEQYADADDLLRRRLSAGALKRIANYAAFVLSGMEERESLTITPRACVDKS